MSATGSTARAKAYLFPARGTVHPLPQGHVAPGDDGKGGAVRPDPSSGRDAPRWRAWMAQVGQAFVPALLLLVWDVNGLSAVVARKQGKSWRFSEEASSHLGDFARALEEALDRFRRAGIKPPNRCYIAARFIVPARVDLPVNPEKPRPFLQMRELARAEMEPTVAEAGALWTIGAVLAARGLIDADARERLVLELALRREQSNKPTYFGQVAVELGLAAKDEVQEALAVQEKLQTLEASLACGWAGYKGEPGESPVWLASATGLALWRQVEMSCKRHGLKLLGGLPLAWSTSETEEDAKYRVSIGRMEPGVDAVHKDSRIALEIHAEDVVAVLRHRGRIVSARTEGRMERPLTVDWLLRLVADWRASGVDALEIVCCKACDEARVKALLEDFAGHWGQMPRLREAVAARRGVLECLARQYGARELPLPAIHFSEPPRPVWQRIGFWHILCPLLVLAVCAGLEIDQRMKVKAIQTRFDLAEVENKRQAAMKQQEAGIMLSAKREIEELEAARKQLVRLMPELARLQAIELMSNQLPLLLRTLARSINDDVVLETVRNSRSGSGDIGIMVVGWTTSYGSAQAFAQQVQKALVGYVVAQTDVTSGPGRYGQPGYFVSFWLIPKAAQEELGADEEEAALDAAGAAR